MLDVARHAQIQFGLALLVLSICLAALAIRNVFGRPLAPDLVLPTWLRAWTLPEPWRRRVRLAVDGGLVTVAGLLALLAMTASRPSGAGLDPGHVLREVIQAKYHAELGWDRLYACAWAADHDAQQALGKFGKIRSLTIEPVPRLSPMPTPEYRIELPDDESADPDQASKPARKVAIPGTAEVREPPPPNVGGELLKPSTAAKRAKCKQQFDEHRWVALGADVATLRALAADAKLGPSFQKFGTTATPARLARQRLVFSLLPISAGSLFALTLLGGLLTVGALLLLGRAHGLRAAALVGTVCFIELSASPVLGGVSVSGPLVLAAMIGGFAAIELERWALAGVLLAFAAVELVWPVAFVLALLAKLGVDWLEGLGGESDFGGRGAEKKARPRKRELARFLVAAMITACVLLLLSATLPGGLGNWSIWADRVAVHRYADGSRQVGLQWLFVPDGSWLGGPRALTYPERAQLLVDRRDWSLLCGALLLVPALLAVRRLPPSAFAAIAGVTAIFALFSTDAASLSLGVPLLALAAASVAKHNPPSQLLVGRPTTVLVAGTLALCLGMHGLVRIHSFQPWVFNMVYSHLVTTLLLGLGVALLLLPGLRELGDPPGAPASIPALLPGSGRRKKPGPASSPDRTGGEP
jgi:hypothetical protein